MEAASKVSDSTRLALPEVPWAEIVGMRNRLVHAYFDIDIDNDVLWQSVVGHLPSLATRLRRALGIV